MFWVVVLEILFFIASLDNLGLTHRDYSNVSIVNSFFLTPVNHKELESLIKEMNTSKSAGPYSIPTNVLKLSYSVLSKPLAKLINFSFS